MAEKKFFVDINLQGNKLVNPVVGSNSSMTAEGSFQYNAGRLEYYNGSTVQEVANLNDIAAVTGGLILQGGYDADTNTPDIAADASVLKGFFWVVTAAGSFLGEAVQVGDSIIAKQDNPGATAANWLILQGNVVIATDSVDGISRLATQAEADAGTEGGAVVITPATLQGKIDAQVTPEINNKLPLAGGTMSGNIDMDGNEINNLNAVRTDELTNRAGTSGLGFDGDNITFGTGRFTYLQAPVNGGDAANKTYVDNQDALKLSKSGDTMSGNLDMDSNSITNLLAPTNDGDAANKLYADNASNDKLPLAGGTMSGAIDMGTNNITNVAQLQTYELKSADNNPNAPITVLSKLFLGDKSIEAVSEITGLNTPITSGDQATNKTYVDGAASTAESNANAYTDTAISQEITDRNNAIKATSFTATIEGSTGTSGWTFDATLNAYKATITHNLGNFVTVSTFYDTYPTEFAGEYGFNEYFIYSNIEPLETTVVNFVKSGGNL